MSSLFSTPKAPAAPDPVATANAQGAANEATARVQQKMNMVNQYGPQGSVVYNPIGDDRYEQRTTLSPKAQQSYDIGENIDLSTNQLAQDQIARIRQAVAKELNYSGMPNMNRDYSADRARVTDSIIERNRPQMERTRMQQETQLKNQGLAPGSEAWKNAMDDLARQENDFRLAADSAGGAEQSRLFGLDQTARQQLINEMLQERSQPINEMAALLGTGQVSMPQAAGIPGVNIAPPDVQGAYNTQYAGKLNAYNQQMGASNSAMGGLAGIGGSIASALPWASWLGPAAAVSDVRLKTDITLIGSERGFPIYTFRYRADPDGPLYRGVMAQDVMDKRPDAVELVGDYLAVDYGKIGIEFGPMH